MIFFGMCVFQSGCSPTPMSSLQASCRSPRPQAATTEDGSVTPLSYVGAENNLITRPSHSTLHTKTTCNCLPEERLKRVQKGERGHSLGTHSLLAKATLRPLFQTNLSLPSLSSKSTRILPHFGPCFQLFTGSRLKQIKLFYPEWEGWWFTARE